MSCERLKSGERALSERSESKGKRAEMKVNIIIDLEALSCEQGQALGLLLRVDHYIREPLPMEAIVMEAIHEARERNRLRQAKYHAEYEARKSQREAEALSAVEGEIVARRYREDVLSERSESKGFGADAAVLAIHLTL